MQKSIRKYIIMSQENINQELRIKKIDEIRNYLIKEINQNKLMSKKHKKSCRVLNSFDHLLIVISTITELFPFLLLLLYLVFQ